MANLIAGKADGYTVVTYIADNLGMVPSGTAWHKIAGLKWIVRTQVAPSFLFVKTDSPYKTIQDLAKENPGKLFYRQIFFSHFSFDNILGKIYLVFEYKLSTISLPFPPEAC